MLERNKGALYAIYNRALREDASLQGKFVVEFTIAPNGSVTSCTQVSSELKNPELEQKLLARFRSMTFPAEDVETLVTTLPDRLPAVLIPRASARNAGPRDALAAAGVFHRASTPAGDSIEIQACGVPWMSSCSTC